MALVPASIRNRNPGAQEPGPSSRKFGSASHEVLRWTYKGKPAINKIATFPTNQHGAAAMLDLLNRKYTGRTIQKAVSTWCGDYYAAAYAKALEGSGGVKASDTLTSDMLRKPEFAIALCKAMARVEAGRDFPMSDDEWAEAHAMAFGSGVAPEFSPDNDVPSPGPRARQVAELKEIAKIAAPAVGVAGGGTAAITSQKPTEPAPVKSTPPTKEVLAKAKERAKEVRETVDVARDYASWARDAGKAAHDNWMILAPVALILVGALAWPKIRDRFA
jgi:hypothetical protein